MQRRQLLKGLLGLTALPLVPKFLSLGRVQAFSYYTNHITSTIMPVLVPPSAIVRGHVLGTVG
jgi:hypothetical protein